MRYYVTIKGIIPDKLEDRERHLFDGLILYAIQKQEYKGYGGGQDKGR